MISALRLKARVCALYSLHTMDSSDSSRVCHLLMSDTVCNRYVAPTISATLVYRLDSFADHVCNTKEGNVFSRVCRHGGRNLFPRPSLVASFLDQEEGCLSCIGEEETFIPNPEREGLLLKLGFDWDTPPPAKVGLVGTGGIRTGPWSVLPRNVNGRLSCIKMISEELIIIACIDFVAQ